MGQRIVPAVILMAVLAFAAGALSLAFVLEHFRYWSASVALVVLGGVTPMIFAVNARIVPVFSGRTWKRPNILYAAMISAIAGAWMVFAGRAMPHDLLETAGTLMALAGGLLFLASIIMLFRSPRRGNGPPLPYPGQAEVDKVGTRFMRLASIYLVLGLITGVALSFWTPTRGRWDLVWAHLMLVGWFVSMASGVLYHIMSRWTGGQWKRVKLIHAHYYITLVALPLMVIALAENMTDLFKVAGPLQATAVILLVVNIFPLARKLPPTVRTGVIAAACFLALGVSLGASVAMDPVNHTALRLSHAQINLYGWAGLLISGVGYYLFPRFAGHPLRWPRIAQAQVVLLLVSVIVSSTAWWRFYRGNANVEPLLTVTALTITASFLVFATLIGLTFMSARAGVTTNTIQPSPRIVPRR